MLKFPTRFSHTTCSLRLPTLTPYAKTQIAKTQLNHNQVEVGLTRLWVLTHPPHKLCVAVVQLSSNQKQITDKSYKAKIEFGLTKFPTQFFSTLLNFRPNFCLTL